MTRPPRFFGSLRRAGIPSKVTSLSATPFSVAKMISLTDIQLETVMTLARQLEPEKRAAYLQRFAAELGRHSGRINNANVAAAAETALASLVQNTAA